MRRLLLAGLMALGACASLTPVTVPTEPFPPTVVDLPVPPSSAFDLALAAFLGSGYSILDSDRASGRIRSAAVPGESYVGSSLGGLYVIQGQSEYFITATIAATSSGARVFLGANQRSSTTMSGRTEVQEEAQVMLCQPGESDPARECRAAQERLRARLEALADAMLPPR